MAFFGALPAPLRWVLPPLTRRGLRAQMRGHGMGRHSADEIFATGCRDVDALADKPLMLGDPPRSQDASAHAFLARLLQAAALHWATQPDRWDEVNVRT